MNNPTALRRFAIIVVLALLSASAQAQEAELRAQTSALGSGQTSYDRVVASMAPTPTATTAPVPSVATLELECATVPFGQSLFDGGQQKSGSALMSPKQQVQNGDRITIAAWGAVQQEEVSTVDSQGFIYIKGVGPVFVQGTADDNLSATIQREVSRVFHDDVRIYATLQQNTGTPVLVTGGVEQPGQYNGSAQDNIVAWLRRAGGISPKKGSYRDISVERNGAVIEHIDLYDFLERGKTKNINWQPGDVIVVGKPAVLIGITGDVRRCGQYEFPLAAVVGADIINYAQLNPGTTHAIVKGYRDSAPYTNVFSIETLHSTVLKDGDAVLFYAAPLSQQITVRIDGATLGNKVLALAAGTMLSAVLDQIPVNPAISNTDAVYIRRPSVAKMQKQAIDESVDRLLQAALTAPAQSDGEALIRAKEAELIEAFVTRVKNVKPEGRVVVMQGGHLRDLPLQEGDTIVIPEKTNVVTIEGEVVLPRAVVAKKGASAKDYVMMAGGYTERADDGTFIVIRPNSDAVRSDSPEIQPGDRLLILPHVDTKIMQTAKDLVQILYQIAVGAGVVLTIND